MADWTERRRLVSMGLAYAGLLALVLRFMLRDSFVVPGFIYQNF